VHDALPYKNPQPCIHLPKKHNYVHYALPCVFLVVVLSQVATTMCAMRCQCAANAAHSAHTCCFNAAHVSKSIGSA